METCLRLSEVSKEFPGVLALDAVDLEVARGEVHGLLGENGAGKSTLVKVIAGVYKRDAGEMVFEGKPRSFTSPGEASRAGIAVIHQETSLIPTLTVIENIFLGIEPRLAGSLIDRRRMEREYAGLCERLSFSLDANRVARELSVAQQKMTEIMKALVRRSSLIIMDEPTDALAAEEIDHLFRIVDELRRHGITIIYITHYLDEVFRITDRVTVLRDGRRVDTRSTRELDIHGIVRMMIGQDLDSAVAARRSGAGAEAIRAEGLSRGKAVNNVSFVAREGEILGVTGVLGSGKTELARLLFGADRPDAGRILVGGTPRRIRSPRDAAALGIGMLPEDRKHDGLVLAHEVYKNVTIAALRRFTRWRVIRARAEREATDGAVRRLDIKVARAGQAVRDLSGGNQQKVVIAKWLVAGKRILIMDEPTRGIDVGAKVEIHRIMRELADDGVCVIFISAEVPEIARVSDRILVMREGQVSEELPGGASQEQIMHAVLKGSAS
ncbi:MAG TPA: sugar ABC transporter ATP-binding protein [Spirochaetia bacterium]